MKVYQQIARDLHAAKTCNKEYSDMAIERLERLQEEYLPYGSGIDSGCKIDIEKSTPDKIIITFGFHHLNENGYYDGWTEHKAIVTPSLSWEFNLQITGKNKNNIKDYLLELFHAYLETEIKN